MSTRTRASEGPVIGHPVRDLSSDVRATSVTENANSVLPTSTATTTVEDVTESSLNNHGTHLRGCRKATAQATPDLQMNGTCRSLPSTSGGVREGLPDLYQSGSEPGGLQMTVSEGM